MTTFDEVGGTWKSHLVVCYDNQIFWIAPPWLSQSFSFLVYQESLGFPRVFFHYFSSGQKGLLEISSLFRLSVLLGLQTWMIIA